MRHTCEEERDVGVGVGVVVECELRGATFETFRVSGRDRETEREGVREREKERKRVCERERAAQRSVALHSALLEYAPKGVWVGGWGGGGMCGVCVIWVCVCVCDGCREKCVY